MRLLVSSFTPKPFIAVFSVCAFPRNYRCFNLNSCYLIQICCKMFEGTMGVLDTCLNVIISKLIACCFLCTKHVSAACLDIHIG